MTFDCWGTLLYEPDPAATYARRVEAVLRAADALGWPATPESARRALDRAWTRHWTLWHEGVASGAAAMAGWALAGLAADLDAPRPGEGAVAALADTLAESSLEGDVRVLADAGALLEALARRGVRRALVCDTGFSSGAVVRRLLEREGLGALLEVAVFSDEAGVPKPHPRVFERALRGLGEPDPARAVHVGDLRRTDVAGGRGAGMGTVRIRAHYDDASDLADADHVVDAHDDLRELLEPR